MKARVLSHHKVAGFLLSNTYQYQFPPKSTWLLHQCDVNHTDMRIILHSCVQTDTSNNILHGRESESAFSEIDQGEMERPVARKLLLTVPMRSYLASQWSATGT